MKDFDRKEWLKTLKKGDKVVDTAFTFPSTHIRYAHICFVPSSAD